MTGKEASILIGILKEENKTNSKEERDFNKKWIKCLLNAFKIASEKQ